MPSFIDEQPFFDEVSGKPIVAGKIYIGTQGADPILNPITIYSDRGLSSVLANPQTTDSNGRSTNKIWIPGRYSVQVDDVNDVQKFQDLDAGENPATGTTSLINVLGTNTITANASPAIDALVDGQLYVFKPAVTNTGATTLKIDTTDAKAVEVNGGALTGGELIADLISIVAYNSTGDNFDLTVQVNKAALGLGSSDDVTFNTVNVATGGIYLGGSGAANLLNDFEENDIASLEFANATSGGTASATTVDAHYIKVGNAVMVWMETVDLDTTGLGAGNTLYLRGLPFTCTSDQNCPGSFLHDQWTVDGVGIVPWVVASTTYIEFRQLNSAAVDTAVIVSDLVDDAADNYIQITYYVD